LGGDNLIVTLDEAKLFCKLDDDYTDEDTMIQALINAAEEHLNNATDAIFDASNPLAKLYVNILTNDFYSSRSATESIKDTTREMLKSIALQLQLCYGG
jgi:uncharacterized phage protein (predicted DNA packaging)